MADAVASGVLCMVSDKLGTMVLDELRSLKDVGEELKKLESTLCTIRSVLQDAEARQAKDKTITDWLKKLKDVAYDIDDVLDEAKVEALKHRTDGFRSKEMVRKYLYFPKALQFRHEIAKKIKAIRKRLDEISMEKSSFHLREGTAEQHSEVNVVPSRESGSYVDKSQVYGREEEKKQIIDFLLTQFIDKSLGVISIVGLGGLGKTTLAQLVYNDDAQVSEHFLTKIWVHVSDKFEIKNVVRSIIESLTKREFKFLSMDSMEQELLEQIKGKRFLLVLDDVWTEDYEPWEKLASLLKNGAKGSKVIVTTRSTRVASVMKSDKLHSLRGLPDHDCWKLFQNNAFESDGDCAKNPNLVAIGKEIVRKCGGLPLAAKALGSLLRFTTKESEWREVMDNEIWKQFQDDNHILPALMLSYKHLSPRLKQCFAYCSIFPKGTQIKVKMLVQSWVAEGFVSSSAGSQFVDQLISRSLLENEFNEFDGGILVKMHDMVHNLSQFVAGDACSILNATRKSNTHVSQNTRYASLVLNEETLSTAQILSNGEKLRTLHLICNRINAQGGEDICQQMVDSIFSNLKCLRALSLPTSYIKKLPATMKKLVHLRYLDLSYTWLSDLPETIGFLHNLQTLNLSFTQLEILPKSIGNLVNLLTLNISYCRRLRSLPDTIGELVQLQYLNLSSTFDLQTLPSTIGYLENLRTLDLRGCLLEQFPESIGSLANLLTLKLRDCIRLHFLPESISTLQNLQKMDLSLCEELESLPESICGLTNLLTLKLRGCKSLRFLPDKIGCIRNLQFLDISYVDDLNMLPESMSSLYNLQRLHLHYCCKLTELPKKIQGMRNLTHLHIDGCDSLTSMPAGIAQLTQLRMLPMYVVGTDGENNASLAELGTLMNLGDGLRIKNLQNVNDVSEASAVNLRGKKILDILGLEWEFDADWTDENYESIHDFENKRKASVGRVAALDRDGVRLLEDVLRSLQPHQNLRNLEIIGYVGKMLPGWMIDLKCLVVLKLESFARCDSNLQALEQLSCLEELKLKRFPFIESLPRLGQLPSLMSLELCMLPGVKCLGSELCGGRAGAFPALKELVLQFMVGLEEWSGTADDGGSYDFLSRLSVLVVRGCPRLQTLPSTFLSVYKLRVNADDELLLSYLQRGAFPNLKKLYVYNCLDVEDEKFTFGNLSVYMHSLEYIGKDKKRMRWNHSEDELEMMRLETLEGIAAEIEKKLVIKPSSS